MKITSVLRNILLEDSRFENLYTKFVEPTPSKDPAKPNKPKLKFDTLKQFIFADPTSKMPDNVDAEGLSIADIRGLGNKFKVGAYTQWLLKNFFKPTFQGEQENVDPSSPEYKEMVKEFRRLFLEDLFKMNDIIGKFERVKPLIPAEQRDINSYTPATLTNLILNLPEELKAKIQTKDVKSQARQERKENRFSHPGATIMKEGTNYTLIKIEGTDTPQKEAAQWYGGFYDYMNGESHWCTSPPGSNYFMTYASAGPLYVIMANDDKGQVGARTGLPTERYQINFPKNQFMDRMDGRFDVVEKFNGDFAEFKDILKPEFAKGFVVPNTDEVEITYPGSSAGVFIALYGFDDLIKSLPKTIKQLHVSNTSNTPVYLNLTDAIGDFTELDTLLLQNVVKEIPESIGNLRNLDILSLTDNKELKSLPNSILNLENLTFLVLTGSSVEMSGEMAEEFMETADGVYSRI